MSYWLQIDNDGLFLFKIICCGQGIRGNGHCTYRAALGADADGAVPMKKLVIILNPTEGFFKSCTQSHWRSSKNSQRHLCSPSVHDFVKSQRTSRKRQSYLFLFLIAKRGSDIYGAFQFKPLVSRSGRGDHFISILHIDPSNYLKYGYPCGWGERIGWWRWQNAFTAQVPTLKSEVNQFMDFLGFQNDIYLEKNTKFTNDKDLHATFKKKCMRSIRSLMKIANTATPEFNQL